MAGAGYEVRAEPVATGYDRPMPMPMEEQLEPMTNDNHIRPINIEQLDYGYIIRVGCQRFAVETHEKVINALNEYMTNPDETQRKWFSGEKIGLNK